MFIIKIPFNNSERTKGCEKAPNEILNELKNIHSNEQGKIIDEQLLDLEEIHVDNSNIEKSNELIYKNAFEIFGEKPRAIFLGGGHSISYSTGRAFFDYCESKKNQGSSYDISFKNGSGLRGKEPCLIIFDAHADCEDLTENLGNRNWLRRLIEDGFPTENIILVGVRNMWKDEIEFLKGKRIRMISMNALLENFNDCCEIIMEFASGKELYVSIDINFIDPAFAPGTDYPETGGLSSREFIYLISRINKMKNLRAVDIVEINPDKDEKNLTIKLAAKVLAELL